MAGQVKGMRRRDEQKKVLSEKKFKDIPAWARDNLVLRMLDDVGFKLRVIYDEKYLHGICDKPLLVISSRDQHIYTKKSGLK